MLYRLHTLLTSKNNPRKHAREKTDSTVLSMFNCDPATANAVHPCQNTNLFHPSTIRSRNSHLVSDHIKKQHLSHLKWAQYNH